MECARAKRFRAVLLVLYLFAGISCRPASPGAEAPESPESRYQYTQLHLGVQVRIVLHAQKEALAREAARRAFNRIAELEDIFSHYRPRSEVSRLTEHAESPVRVSDELFLVLQRATNLAAETDGAFDPTVGRLVDLWRASRTSGRLPDAGILTEALNRTGWRHLELNADSQTVRLHREGIKLDLGGIAKGYILDEALTELESAGLDRALIEAGGDIVVSGPPPGKEGWRIEILKADSTAAIANRARTLQHAAIATSGDTEQFVEIDGVRYSHVVDPRTGLGLQTRRMATVIAPDGLTADSYATALTVLTKAGAAGFLERHPEVMGFVR
jgi:thiamine biosynthesis lipoprotein